MAKLVITIDGPAGSGKSTAARLLAKEIDASFLDTGAMYRAATIAAIKAGVDMSDRLKLREILEKSEFKFDIQNGVMTAAVNGEDVTEQLRRPEVTGKVHCIASAGEIREKLVRMQRKFASNYEKIVTEGRDQGTIVFPKAKFKFFLTASPAQRVKRRYAELQARGEKISLEQLQKDIERRDKSDYDRIVGPLKPAPDAVIIDTTDLNIEQVVQKLFDYVKNAAKAS